ncbi:UDP binding domain-containing protein [Streptomyces sp. NPDC005898]|uniref:UDP binding domain-containing protein n=1 Tax=Streptomyces sp. NPDC005898 TaxID=3157082 RepID=UPI0033DA7C60
MAAHRWCCGRRCGRSRHRPASTPPSRASNCSHHELGAEVTVSDPKALDNARKTCPELDFVADPVIAVQDADLLLHLTEWPQFSLVDPRRLAAGVSVPNVIDGRGTLDPVAWREAGWNFRALGCP